MDLERARLFVAQHGTPIERARLHALLDDVAPRQAPPELTALQNPDGGFPFEFQSGNPSALYHSALALDWLRDLGQHQSETARGVYAFIRSRQRRRGLWRESDELRRFELPLWMDPESTAGDVYTTALCGAAVIPSGEGDLAADRAVAWLQTQQGRDGLLHGFKLHASSLAVPVFAHILGQEARATRRLVGGLGEALGPEWTPPMLANLLRRLLDAGYGPRTRVVARAWEMLQGMQEADGSFSPGDEPESATSATLLAIGVARQFGQTADS